MTSREYKYFTAEKYTKKINGKWFKSEKRSPIYMTGFDYYKLVIKRKK